MVHEVFAIPTWKISVSASLRVIASALLVIAAVAFVNL
ncbi:hypothetical protein BRUCa_0289 [Brucella melitensis]|nr:hypothetical protein BM28_A0292 [Brucella melitensis M28]AEQ07914.1 hypothetical protein BMNI_I0286 [Brucella melitensis NI]